MIDPALDWLVLGARLELSARVHHVDRTQQKLRDDVSLLAYELES